MSYSLVLDLVLALLLAATIGFAAVLNRRLAALRSAKDEMEAMIGQFIAATDKAEVGLAELKARAENATGELETRVADASKRLDNARAMADELAFLVEKGGGVAGRLEKAITAARDVDGRRGKGGDKDRGAESPLENELLKTLDSIR